MADEESPALGAPPYRPPGRGLLQRFRKVAVLVAAVVLVAGFGAELAAGFLRPSLAPPQVVGEAQERWDPQAIGELRRRFPRDPRVLLLSAFYALREQDGAAAEEHLRAVLKEERTIRREFPDGKFEATVRSILARLLLEKGQESEAREVLRPSCGPQLDGVADKAALEAGWVREVCTPT